MTLGADESPLASANIGQEAAKPISPAHRMLDALAYLGHFHRRLTGFSRPPDRDLK